MAHHTSHRLPGIGWILRGGSCVVVLLLLMTVSQIMIMLYLGQDSRTLEPLAHKGNVILDRTIESGILDTVDQAALLYRTILDPRFRETARALHRINTMMDMVATDMEQRNVVTEVRSMMEEGVRFMHRIDRYLNQSALHFNINM